MDFDSLLHDYKTSSQPPPRSSAPRAPPRPQIIIAPPPPLSRARVLIVLAAGSRSLHESWPYEDGITLCVMWYDEANEPSSWTKERAEFFARKRGQKWVLVREAMNSVVKGDWRKDYDVVWFPDDDLKFDSGTVMDLARCVVANKLDLVQPCLLDKNITSASYRGLVLRSNVQNAWFHRTNFVEIMCPMFSTKALDYVFSKTMDDDRCKSGWGLDSVWPALLRNVAVVDSVRMEHTRPPNAFANAGATSYAGSDPSNEELELMGRFRIAPYIKLVLQVVVTDFKRQSQQHPKKSRQDSAIESKETSTETILETTTETSTNPSKEI